MKKDKFNIGDTVSYNISNCKYKDIVRSIDIDFFNDRKYYLYNYYSISPFSECELTTIRMLLIEKYENYD